MFFNIIKLIFFFRLTTVELIRQNKGFNSSLRLQVAAVESSECGAIPWDEFQVRVFF